MATVKAIIGFDTLGAPLAEASSAGASVSCNTDIAHVNAVQNASLALPQAAGGAANWVSQQYAVTGAHFSMGFWINAGGLNMGGAYDQDIILFSTDGGPTLDWSLNHLGGYPAADSHYWRIRNAAGTIVGIIISEPLLPDTWHWVTVDIVRHASAGSITIKVWNDWPATTAYSSGTISSINTEGSTGTSAVIFLAGHDHAPAGGGFGWHCGGLYLMDGATGVGDFLPHQEFLSLRPTKNSAVPDCDETGGGSGDNLTTGTWDLAGDETVTTEAIYSGGAGVLGGAVKSAEYNIHSKLARGDATTNYGIGKFIFNVQIAKLTSGRYVYGFSDVSGYTVTNVGFSGTGIKYAEKLVFFGDTYYPRFAWTGNTARAIPVGGHVRTSGTSCDLREWSYLTMWQKNAPTEAADISRFDHFTRGVGRGVCRGVTR